jgi:RNA polymerase sigma-70 factor (ECF subfamily)
LGLFEVVSQLPGRRWTNRKKDENSPIDEGKNAGQRSIALTYKHLAPDRDWLRRCISGCSRKGAEPRMHNHSTVDARVAREAEVADKFLDNSNTDSFADLFSTFSPQLVAFYRVRGCELGLAEDLAQEVMLTVYRKAAQVRDRALFRAWLFKIARNTLCRHYRKQTREVETVNFAETTIGLAAVSVKASGIPAFEFLHWMAFLDSGEREIMKLRFIEQWEYHEIATARQLPIGTVQWRVFNAKKKLALHLAPARTAARSPEARVQVQVLPQS